MSRPTLKELDKKLREARRILTDEPSAVVIIDRLKWTAEWERLLRYIALPPECGALWEDKLKIVLVCFAEMKAADHFWRGHRSFCVERGFESVELWEFKWVSSAWNGKKLYTKFGFKNGKLCFLSFHPDEPERSKVRKAP